MSGVAADERWLIESHKRIIDAGWRIEIANDRWHLYAPDSIAVRFKLTIPYRVGLYRTMAEASAAFEAIQLFDWISQLRRPAYGISDVGAGFGAPPVKRI